MKRARAAGPTHTTDGGDNVDDMDWEDDVDGDITTHERRPLQTVTAECGTVTAELECGTAVSQSPPAPTISANMTPSLDKKIQCTRSSEVQNRKVQVRIRPYRRSKGNSEIELGSE